MTLRLSAATLVTALLLSACGGAATPAPIVPTIPAATEPTAATTDTTGAPAATAVLPATEPTPPAGEFPAATENLTDTIPGADAPAIEPGPGTAVPGADTLPIESGDSAAANQIAPELEQAIRAQLAADPAMQNAQLGDVAVEDTVIRVQITPEGGTPSWLFLRADLEGYKVIWGPSPTTITAEEAQTLSIPATLIP
jgi:hypothetical protein